MSEATDTEPGTPLLFARVLDGTGGGRAIDWAGIQEWEPAPQDAGPGDQVLWMHLCRNTPGVYEWLQERIGIPEPTAELLTSDDTRPRAFREGNTLVATLRGINFNPGAEPEDMISMQVWSDGVRLITLRRHPLQTPREILAQIDRGAGPGDVGAIITALTESMVTRMNASIVDMNEQIDALEDMDMDDDPEAMLGRIATIRRNCLGLKRHMGPQHVAFELISREAPPWFEEHDRREIAETIDRLRRYLDDIDVSKESAVVLMDELRTRALASNERATYMLTIVAGIFLPLGFLTGLLGINVGGMPGVNDGHAFWWVTGICLAIIAVLMAIFKRLKWL
ncbi:MULTISPECIES: zinc transporter ZntB [unclassified Citromicrobium]|uniref:zinc transporter ZntB n=1 Tax=unclassified Citromicrobium TaxID=2630544 RepID=UPI0006C91B76|nr:MULTISPECIES: zinc transporter ZntB [unclassified Citromicrobium]MAO05422.1 zinc transporter ZntB [Citromicrobium sp.]OAM07482.1 magnesium transporter [Citromicrobium sp. RCC1897]|tara:strand:- start:7721 stop:8734 length:1014 start_codon:yes stop_codon:yes gene_type:complete